MQQVIDVLAAERDELRSGWLEKQIVEFRGRHNGATASTPAPQMSPARKRANRRRAAGRVASGRLEAQDRRPREQATWQHRWRRGQALNLERTVTGTRLAQMAKSGELEMAARRYKAA